jgi:hypothetical protein
MQYKIGDIIYVLSEYNLCKGEVVSINKTTVKVVFQIPWCIPQVKNVKLEKLCGADEEIVIVWEMWKGKNGRGSYRIERDLYREYSHPSKLWPHQEKVWEVNYGDLLDNDCAFSSLRKGS